MLSLGQQMPPHSTWAIVMIWASPGFAALTGAVMPLLKDQGARWGVQFKVWRSQRVMMKVSTSPGVSEEAKAEALALLNELHKQRLQAEMRVVREAYAED